MKLFFFDIRFWRGMPALLAFIFFVVFGIILLRANRSEVQSRYTSEAIKALYGKQYDKARVAYQRLIMMENGTNLEAVLNLAISMELLNRHSESAELLKTIAPVSKARYAPAHIYVAKSLVKEGKLAPEDVPLFELHLRHALSLDPNSVDANQMLGGYYYEKKEWGLAKKYLKAVVGTNPGILLMMVDACKQTNDESGLKTWAQRMVDYWQNEVETKNSEKQKDRLLWANGLILLERFSEAVNVLDEGQRITHEPVYRQAMADAYSLWGQNLARKEPENLLLRIRTIQKGLQISPKNRGLLELLFAINHNLEGREGIATRDALVKIQAEGGATAIIHFIQGNDLLVHGDAESARKHFEIAYGLDPKMLAVGNNLAVLLVQTKNPDLERALSIIQAVLEKSPSDPNFRDTRGQIYIKIGKWKEAVADLEFALPMLEAKNSTHAALAEAYTALGMPELASEHKRLSEVK